MDSARALVSGDGVSLVSRCLTGVACQLHVILRRTGMTGKMVAAAVTQMIRMCFSYTPCLSGELPTYGYRRVWRCFDDRPNLMVCLINAKTCLPGSCARMRCCLSEKTAVPPSKRAHTWQVAVKESNQRWCSDWPGVPR